MLTSGVVLLHDNARPYTAGRTRALLEHFSWELFDHPPYSPDLALSDYHLFTYLSTYLKNLLRTQRFNSNEELMEGVDTGIRNLIPRYKCINSVGDYVEK
jgi:histone-lysine N-methyltransferase SETMAR